MVDPGASTGVTAVLARDGDRGMLTFPGAIASLTVAAVDPQLIRRARHIHVSSFFLQRALTPDLPALFADVRRNGTTVSVDPNWDPSGAWDDGLPGLLGAIDILMPNAVEAMHISGRDGSRRRRACAQRRRGDGRGQARCRRRARGRDREPRSARAPPDGPPPVDTIGAGDSFDAGLLAGVAGRRAARARR